MRKRAYTIDGADFDSLEGFYEQVGRVLIPGAVWGRNLDAFDDILYGGFGTPDNGFRIRWLNSMRSRQVLGRGETVRFWEEVRMQCHPDNRKMVNEKLQAAERGEGPMLFDTLVEIIKGHAPEVEMELL